MSCSLGWRQPGAFATSSSGSAKSPTSFGIEDRARHARALERLADQLLPVDGEVHGPAQIRIVEGRLRRVQEDDQDGVDRAPGRRRPRCRAPLAARRPAVLRMGGHASHSMDLARLRGGELGGAADEDELLDAVEVRQARDEVVLVLLPLDHAAALVLLELERPRADLGLGLVEVAELAPARAWRRRGTTPTPPRAGTGAAGNLSWNARCGSTTSTLATMGFSDGAALRALEVGVEDRGRTSPSRRRR